jgi:hypothetical protein
MPRPKSEDPKIVVTLRLRASKFEAYKAQHPDWRAALEAHVNGEKPQKLGKSAAGIVRGLSEVLDIQEGLAEPARVHVAVPLKEPSKFRPNPKRKA